MKLAALLGRRDFALLWSGQLVSMIGSGLSAFALGIWVYQTTGSASRYALIFVCAAIPAVLASLFAGALVDRWDRRRTLIGADIVAAVATLGAALLAASGRLEIWHVYGIAAVVALVSAFHIPAYAASLPLLLPEEDLPRANGMVQMARATAQVLGPMLAGALVSAFSLTTVLIVDCLSFVVAIAALTAARIPRPRLEPAAGSTSLLQEVALGWRYVRERAGLLSMLLVFGGFNFALGILVVLITPLVLAFATPRELGFQMSIGGCGLVAGGLAMSLWGGPRRRIHGVLGGMALAGVAIALHSPAPSIVLLAAAGFCFFFTLPVMNAANDSIWQVKVPPDYQGRSFALQRMLSEAAMPLGFALAGPLADRVFEPLLAADTGSGGGAWAGGLGRLIGTGPGRGIAAIFLAAGLFMTALAGCGYLFRPLRRVEEELPDCVPSLPSAAAGAPALAAELPVRP